MFVTQGDQKAKILKLWIKAQILLYRILTQIWYF